MTPLCKSHNAFGLRCRRKHRHKGRHLPDKKELAAMVNEMVTKAFPKPLREDPK